MHRDATETLEYTNRTISTQSITRRGYPDARRIRFLRGELSQHEFSELVGVSRSAIANYETGRLTPNKVVSSKIAEGMKTPLSYFSDPEVTDSGDPTAVYAMAIEGRPGWTVDEQALVRAIRFLKLSNIAEMANLVVE